jgi:hypothetical protein
MPDDFDLVVSRRRGAYLIVAPDYGVVVRRRVLLTGVGETLQRMAAITEMYRDEGRPLPTPSRVHGAPKPASNVWRFFTATLVSLVTFSGFVAIGSAPFFSAEISLTGLVGEAVSSAGRVSPDSIARVTAARIVRTGDEVETMGPQLAEELRVAVRKILKGLAPAIDEVRQASDRWPPPAPDPSP